MPFLRIALVLAAALLPAARVAQAAELTPTEQRWLRGAWPVIEQARAQRMPLDIVVQPQPTPGLAPLALAFVEGRCKLVLSMRGNDEATAQLQRLADAPAADEAWTDAALALMAAHEVFGHCARHLAGQWHGVPEGYVDAPPPTLPAALHADYAAMRATRREEAYADLAALAWAREHRPALQARLHAWLVAERAQDLVEGSHHDTLAWIRQPGAGAVESRWREVLQAEAAVPAAGPGDPALHAARR